MVEVLNQGFKAGQGEDGDRRGLRDREDVEESKAWRLV